MVSQDTLHPNKYNFFACLPEMQAWNSEVNDIVQTSVKLYLKEAKKRDVTSISFSIATPVDGLVSAEYHKVLLESIKDDLDGERKTAKPKTVMFCAKGASHIHGFVQTLEEIFGKNQLEINYQAREIVTISTLSSLVKNPGNQYVSNM